MTELTLSYSKVLEDYMETGQEASLCQVAEFSKELMKQGIGPDTIVEMHLEAVKKINKGKKVYPRKAIDKSFTFLMQGIMAYGMAHQEQMDVKREGYLAEIRELNRRLSRRLTEITALHETIKATGSSLDLDEVLSSVFDNAVKTLKADDGSLMLFDPEEGVLTIKKAYGLDEKIVREIRIKPGEGVAGLVFQSGEPFIHGREGSPQITGMHKYESTNSICVPLKTRTTGVIGIININREGDSELFTENNLKFLSAMAHEAATAIESASLYQNLRKSYISIIRALSSALEQDPYIIGHSCDVAKYAVAIAKNLGMSFHEIEGVEVAGILHDIGKVGIHEDILNKPWKLDDEEWKEVKRQAESSFNILNGVDFPWNIKDIVYSHHERHDGMGYPAGLKGSEIPLGARILAVADAYEAMTSDRAHRKALTKEAAVKELKRVAGTQLDPEIVKVFIETLMSGKEEKKELQSK